MSIVNIVISSVPRRDKENFQQPRDVGFFYCWAFHLYHWHAGSSKDSVYCKKCKDPWALLQMG